ncbi:MAG: FAD-dependent oxidoreductase [Methylobacteriaceae bacterium]|nr:FAD-dependent oxidoreductase [Methylobacteriaceae bacterium]
MNEDRRASGSRTIDEPARKTPLFGEYDLVVLGGGPAGIAAAAVAARAGLSTLLIERHGFLGGMGTAAGVTNFCGLHANVHGELRQVVHGIADDLLARIDRLGGLNAPHVLFGGKSMAQAYDNAAYKIAADDLLSASGTKLLFHALAVGVTMQDAQTIDALILETHSGRRAVRARLFIDASGDGDLAAFAGVPYELGDGAGNMLYPSTMFRVNGVDAARAKDAWATIPALMQEAEARGMRFPRKGAIVRPQKHPGEWRVNITQLKNDDGSAIDGTDARQISEGEIQGRRQVMQTFAFLKTVPGFEDCYIIDIAPQVGIRETRRVTCDYMLSEADVLECADFDDTIGVNGWPIEEHISGDVIFRFPDIPRARGYNELPFRMLLPKNMRNLLVAGRCAGMTHGGQSAARVSGACFVMGEAAATAAALALGSNAVPREVDVGALQNKLSAQGVWLG